MMHKIYSKLKQVYKRFGQLRWFLPLGVLIIYTILGAAIFRHLEFEADLAVRRSYKNNTEYAFNQMVKRMLEIRCMDKSMRFNNNSQTRHIKDALFWLFDHMDLTQIIDERTNMNSPWTWMGAGFFAGQLYTTIGYGIPVAITNGGRIASIVYIMIGIPIFLIILKDVGQLLSRALRKLYKRMYSAQKRFPNGRRMSAPVKAIYGLTLSPLAMLGSDIYKTFENNKPEDENSTDDEKVILESTTNGAQPPGILKKPVENCEVDPRKQNEINEKIRKRGHNFPIPLALTILVIWILLSSALFCLWEKDWGFMTSVYFFFVSISTVGLGDIVPVKRDMMIVNFVLILVGLALLSMCINLIQEALEQLINRLLEDYIREFEKIAEIVNTGDDFTEESLKPFEVEMTDMLTVPLTTITHDEHRGGIWEIGRNAKDWVAEQVANNLLINRLYPPSYESESSSSEEDSEEEEYSLAEKHDDELKEIVVVDDQRSTAGDIPSIPSISNTLGVRRSSQISNSTAAKDNVSRVSVKTHKKEKKPKSRLRQMNPFFHYNAGTLRAIQMIETAKLRTDRNSDFKSRLFAKFATNTRLTKLVDERPHPPTKMVSFSVQTSPIVEREKKPIRMSHGVGLGSVDSFSSANHTGNDSSMKSFDVDSLCSSAYYDVNFNGYNTESVPQIIAQSTPPMNPKVLNGPNRQSLGSKHSNSPQTSATSAPIIIKLDRSSQSPSIPLADTISRHQRRRYSANCLPISTTSVDKADELPLINSRMPLARCPSCSNVSTDTMPEPQTIQRVHDICGLMPSDFHRHKSPGSRPMSSLSDYENSAAMNHSFHRDTAPSPPSKIHDHSSHIPIRLHPLHRSKRLDDSAISSDTTIEPGDNNQPQKVIQHDRSPMLDSGLGELAKAIDSKRKSEEGSPPNN